MTAILAHIWRHPIKGIGAEAIASALLVLGEGLPMDRAFALRQEGAETGAGWLPCRNFIRGAKGQSLMAITAQSHDDGRITLTHPDRPALTIDPLQDGARLIEWILPIYPENRPRPEALIPSPPEGMGDAPDGAISILSTASLAALSAVAGQGLDMRRFRGNLWIDGLAPWEETQWIGQSIAIGAAEFEITEQITRCRATHANPQTGQADCDILGLLERHFDHSEFGLYARLRKGGKIALGDKIEMLT